MTTAYRRHYEQIGEQMIQGHVTEATRRWCVPTALLAQATFSHPAPLRVLDLGCGDGDIARRFRALPWIRSVTLADVSLPTVTKASRWYGLPGVVAWGEHLPFADNSFAVCLLIGVLEHVLEPAAVIREAERVARWVVAVVPQVADQDPDHVRLYPLDAVAKGRGGVACADGREIFAVWEKPQAKNLRLSTVSCLTAFANPQRDLSEFRRTLAALRQQSWSLHEIIVMDDAPDEDKPAIAALCAEYGAIHMPFAFLNWAIAGSRQYNQAFARSTGDALLLLCPHWVLAPNWVEEMAHWLVELGPGNLVTTDSDRRALLHAAGESPRDWFAGQPDRFLAPHWNYIDNAKVMLWRHDWIPFDEDFDCPEDDLSGERGSNHGLVYWGFEQTRLHGRNLWLRRDLVMEHARGTHTPWMLEKSLLRHEWSKTIYCTKLGKHGARP